MTKALTRLVAVGIVGIGLSASTADSFAQSGGREPVSIAQFDRWMEELSNWGRWGDDDEIGAANLMTAAKRLEAAALVRTGETVSLSHDFLTEEAVDAAEPYVLQMQVNPEGQNSGDRVEVYFHGRDLLPSRRAVPRLLQGQALQRPRLSGRGDRRRVLADGHDADEGRARDARRAGRHAAAEGRPLPRTGHEAVPGGHRGVGGVCRSQAGLRRRAAPAHTAVGHTAPRLGRPARWPAGTHR